MNTVYRAQDAASLANPIAATVFLNAKGKTTFPTFVKAPGSSILKGQMFEIIASGRATTGGSLTWLAALQYTANVNLIAAATATNNTAFTTLSARTIATTTLAWYMRAVCTWDGTSIVGQLQGYNAGTIETADAAISAVAADLSLETAGFVVTGIFGTTNAANVCYLDSFLLKVVA
jgi:type IV secretory pathway VirB2 component (pilin)